MSSIKNRLLGVTAILAFVMALLFVSSPANATVTGAPTPCTAVLKSGTTNKWHISWKAPTHTGWLPTNHYNIHVKGAATSSDVRLDSYSIWLAAPTQYDWTAALPSGWTSPLTFQIKGMDGSGGWGPVCSAAVTTPNTAPKVSAGDDQTVDMPNAALLNGTVSDDGLPTGSTLTQTWSKVSGPGNVSFTTPNAPDTEATFDTAGSYVLKLTASDGTLSANDTVAVTVNAGTGNDPFIPYNSSAWAKKTPPPSEFNQALTDSFHTYMNTKNVDNTSNHNEWHYPWIQGVGGSTGGWGMPYAVGNCSDPVWTLNSGANDSSGGTGKWGSLKTTGFHAPDKLSDYITGTTDSPIVIRDMCAADNPYGTGTFSIWASKVTADDANHVLNIQTVTPAGAYGAFVHASNGLDNRASSDPVDANNGRSRGVIPDTMAIRKDVMDWALNNPSRDLGMALELFMVKTNGTLNTEFPNCFVFPMVNGEQCGNSAQDGWGSEGTRLVLDPGLTDAILQAAPRNCNPQAMVIARTLRKYGMYIGDNAGSASTFKAENESTAHPVWLNTLSKDTLAGCITWDDFKVINPGWTG